MSGYYNIDIISIIKTNYIIKVIKIELKFMLRWRNTDKRNLPILLTKITAV